MNAGSRPQGPRGGRPADTWVEVSAPIGTLDLVEVADDITAGVVGLPRYWGNDLDGTPAAVVPA